MMLTRSQTHMVQNTKSFTSALLIQHSLSPIPGHPARAPFRQDAEGSQRAELQTVQHYVPE